MQDFVAVYYRICFGVLLASIVILAFYVGMLEGKRGGKPVVVLSCTEQMLTAQKISTQTPEMEDVASESIPPPKKGMFAGSKNGTKYYSPGCTGLDRIKPQNIIWFKDAEDATLQGYTPGSC